MYAMQLVWKTGGAVSVTGDTPEEVWLKANAKLRAFPKNYVAYTPVYQAVPSVTFPGVWNTTVPAELKAEMDPENLKLMLNLAD